MLLNYDPDELPPGASAPFIAYYDTEHSVWFKLEFATIGGVAEVGKVDGLTQHLSLFAIIVEVPTALPKLPVNLARELGIDWRLVVALVSGLVLLFWYVHRRRRRRRLPTGN